MTIHHWWGDDFCTARKCRRKVGFWNDRVYIQRKIPDSMLKPDSIWQRHPEHFFMYASTPLVYHYDCYFSETEEEERKQYPILKIKRAFWGIPLTLRKKK